MREKRDRERKREILMCISILVWKCWGVPYGDGVRNSGKRDLFPFVLGGQPFRSVLRQFYTIASERYTGGRRNCNKGGGENMQLVNMETTKKAVT